MMNMYFGYLLQDSSSLNLGILSNTKAVASLTEFSLPPKQQKPL